MLLVGLQHAGSLLNHRRPGPLVPTPSENAHSHGGALPGAVCVFSLIKPSRTLQPFVSGAELGSGLVATRLNKAGPEMRV